MYAGYIKNIEIENNLEFWKKYIGKSVENNAVYNIKCLSMRLSAIPLESRISKRAFLLQSLWERANNSAWQVKRATDNLACINALHTLISKIQYFKYRSLEIR